MHLLMALDYGTGDAPLAEIDGESETNRAAACDHNVRHT
jgi:hypothetical protein